MTDTMKNPLKKRNFPKPHIYCCHRDMCNHVDSPQTKYLINSTLLGAESDIRLENVSNQRPIGYSNSEVWFRAATIAVPICGAVILFVLIALAVKILRKERHSSYNHKLGPPMYAQQFATREKNCYKYHQTQHYDYLKKQYSRPHNPIYRPTTVEMLDYHMQFHAPLLAVPNSIENTQNNSKNEANAKLNQLHCDQLHDYIHSGGKSIILEIEKESYTECPKNELDRNINHEIKFSDIKYGDKNYVKDGPIA
ncbi:hypothetical protein HHI36_007135 [Cryptolaemus montrouzieri]|uniref:BMP and activin membrane-bound inhibitor C-terminal domain-containing protein n=1 Tax=Cryptolaemus montrouzieri TaxID=559131 RepID=A0ABD2MNZ4_9CUCU